MRRRQSGLASLSSHTPLVKQIATAICLLACIAQALITATPAFAAEECLKLKSGAFKYADTATCLLLVDGKLVSSYAKCEISISGDMRSFTIKDVADVAMRGPPNDRRFEARIRKHDKWVNYGLVDGGFFDCGVTFANKRFIMNFLPPYLICDPEVKKKPRERPSASPPNDGQVL